MTKVREIPATPDRLSRFNEFYSLAFGDYLAARQLLLSELFPQAVGLAATAVEKIFKAILSMRGENAGGHLKTTLTNSIKNYQPALFRQLKPDFLEFLSAAYDLRYLDNLSAGFSLVISKYRTLAEIDRTMTIIFSGLQVRHGGEKLALPFERAKAEKNPLLMMENYFVEDGAITRYFARPNFVQEIKIFGVYKSVNITYRTDCGNNSGSFLKSVQLLWNQDETELVGEFSGG